MIIGGICKLFYEKRKIQRYAAIAERKRGHRDLYGEQDTAELRKHAVPFGIRALESGIQVEGVWISQPSTPNPSSPAISTLSTFSGNGREGNPSSSTLGISSLEMSRPLQGNGTPGSTCSNLHMNGSATSFDQAVAAKLVSRSNEYLPLEMPKRKRKYNGVHYSDNKNDGRPTLLRNSATLSALEGSAEQPSLLSKSAIGM